MERDIVLAFTRSSPVDLAGMVDSFIRHLYIHGGANTSGQGDLLSWARRRITFVQDAESEPKA